MTKKPRPESHGKAEESADRSAAGGPMPAAPKSPMARFRSLTKQLLNVSHKQVQEEHRRFNAANAARRQSKKKGA
jgi:hypothetical protein